MPAALGLILAAALALFAPEASRLAVTGSCLLSGIAGVLVPLIMRKCGSDPVTASSIVLTTITDVASLAVFLGLATWIV